MSFLQTSKLISKRLDPRDYRQYFFELLLAILMLSAYLGISDLAGFEHGKTVVFAGASDFALIGALGIYGIRLASFIAAGRRYRMPQTIEWLVFLIPMAVFAASLLASGALVKSDARAHGYRLCGRAQDGFAAYAFAAAGAACPKGVDGR